MKRNVKAFALAGVLSLSLLGVLVPVALGYSFGIGSVPQTAHHRGGPLSAERVGPVTIGRHPGWVLDGFVIRCGRTLLVCSKRPVVVP